MTRLKAKELIGLEFMNRLRAVRNPSTWSQLLDQVIQAFRMYLEAIVAKELLHKRSILDIRIRWPIAFHHVLWKDVNQADVES